MIKIKNLTIRNFMSVGSVTQAIDFDRTELTLILGENLDLGGDGARNGVGKTTALHAVSYALFGVALSSIKKDNLVNLTNAKNMMVTLEFSVDGTEYKIERGRKPAVLRFYINAEMQQAKDDSQGDSRETQAAIERVLGMTAVMFQQIVALNTYTEPFLAMRVSDQRTIIEQLLGVTLLSEKAELVKDRIRLTKDEIQSEEFRVKAVAEANARITEQIAATERRQRLWQDKHAADLLRLVTAYEALAEVDIEAELEAHKRLADYVSVAGTNAEYDGVMAKANSWAADGSAAVEVLALNLAGLQCLDVVAELVSHEELAAHNTEVTRQADIARLIAQHDIDLKRETKVRDKLNAECAQLADHKCYACKQDHFDLTLLNEKRTALETTEALIADKTNERAVLVSQAVKLGPAPLTHYKTESEAVKHSALMESVQAQITAKLAETNPYSTSLKRQTQGVKPTTHYKTAAEAVKHSSQVESLLTQIEAKNSETDPYIESLDDMRTNALAEINFDLINTLTLRMDHEKFLHDLLTNKDSFVRKRILNQNLSFLNARLTHYLARMGLPHSVVFKDDLSVDIEEYGRTLDFGNLSRGETTRLILSLSWAFRDTWESLYRPINVLFIDELLDSGLDSQGSESAVAILKEMARERRKAIFLVSHKDELVSRVNSVLRVVKENGFTSYGEVVSE
jgi:DNA repair exonuclease SbcCD ATPase subunit